MKYIRTDNNIFLIHKDISYGGNKIYKIYNHDFSIIGNNFKVADTIEELCDAYVFVSKSGETHYIYGFDYDMGVKTSGSRIEYDEIFRNHLLENGTVYGAIWTNKGLIYVAEMNEKGELELI